jgi:5-methylcytosine-specific restriction enzyme B
MDTAIKIYTDKLKSAMLEETSIDYSEAIWTRKNFELLKRVVNNNLKVGGQSFDHKFSQQVDEASTVEPSVTTGQQKSLIPLMAEVKSLYYVFISNVSKKRKLQGISAVINADSELCNSLNLTQESFPVITSALSAKAIGSGGMGINTNKQKEIFYLIDAFTAWFGLDSGKREAMLADSGRVDFQNFLDGVSDSRNPQCRHIVLYLLFPEYYEPIISSSQKRRICRIFSEYMDDDLLEQENQPVEADRQMDQKIKVISKELERIRGVQTNFYSKEIRPFWDTEREGSLVDLDTELLEYKKQLVLYGPPGTSKTYTAKALAGDIIRYRMALDMGASVLDEAGQTKLNIALAGNVHRLQLHPAYSYEDFVRGLQIKGGDTQFVKGYLLQLLDKMTENPQLPHVLILDEINRVDLSRLFGECFSALENRGETIALLGADSDGALELEIPDNLYIIGTMNLIDHSVEQLDFALRRRFLWVEASYSAEALLSICEKKWQALEWPGKSFNWEVVETDFERLVSAADNLNAAIANEDDLGGDFVLGHVFFLESVPFLFQQLEHKSRKQPGGYLFKGKGKWRDPIGKLWRLSLYPLLREYLSGVDQKSKATILKKLEAAFRPTDA